MAAPAAATAAGRLSHLVLPFFDDAHRALAAALDEWGGSNLNAIDHHDTDHACRTLVRALGDAGFLRHCVPAAFSA